MRCESVATSRGTKRTRCWSLFASLCEGLLLGNVLVEMDHDTSMSHVKVFAENGVKSGFEHDRTRRHHHSLSDHCLSVESNYTVGKDAHAPRVDCYAVPRLPAHQPRDEGARCFLHT